MRDGWIPVWRKARDNEYHFTKERRAATRWEAREDLWMMAAVKPEKIPDSAMELQPGQILTSISYLADRWRWSRCKVRQFLDLLASDGEILVHRQRIATQIATKSTVLTLCNFKVYRILSPPNRQQNRQPIDHIGKEETQNQSVSRTFGDRSETHRGRATLLVAKCEAIARPILGYPMVRNGTVPKMTELLRSRDEETILEVFTHFAKTRKKPITLTFGNFFEFYDEHERATVRDLPAQEEPHEQAPAKSAQGR